MNPTSAARTLVIISMTAWIFMSWNLRLQVMAVNNRIRPLNRDTPITIHNDLGGDVKVLCTGWPQALDPQDRVIQTTLRDQQVWNVDSYGRDLFQERLFCEFRHYEHREWNCLRVFHIYNMCVYEKNPGIAPPSPNPDSCPVCNVRNNEGEITCFWRLLHTGISLLRRDVLAQRNVMDVKTRWTEISPPPYFQVARDPEQLFELSVQNFLDAPVTLQCGVRGDFNFRGFSEEHGAMEYVRTLQVEEEAANNGGDASWVCDVVVDSGRAGRWRRRGITFWDSPDGYDADDAAREPPCIDCAWSFHRGSLWVGRSGCDDNQARWERRYRFFG